MATLDLDILLGTPFAYRFILDGWGGPAQPAHGVALAGLP